MTRSRVIRRGQAVESTTRVSPHSPMTRSPMTRPPPLAVELKARPAPPRASRTRYWTVLLVTERLSTAATMWNPTTPVFSARATSSTVPPSTSPLRWPRMARAGPRPSRLDAAVPPSRRFPRRVARPRPTSAMTSAPGWPGPTATPVPSRTRSPRRRSASPEVRSSETIPTTSAWSCLPAAPCRVRRSPSRIARASRAAPCSPSAPQCCTPEAARLTPRLPE